MLNHKYEPDINAEIYEIFKTQNGNFQADEQTVITQLSRP